MLALLASCGKQSPALNQSGSATGDTPKETAACSQEYIDDYNGLMEQLRDMVKPRVPVLEDVEKSEGMVSKFSAKYKDVECECMVTNLNTGKSEKAVINTNSKMAKLKEFLVKARKAAENGQPIEE